MHRRHVLVAPSAALMLSATKLARAQESGPEMARRMRELFFTIRPDEADIRPTTEIPSVFGISVDWPMGLAIATIVAYADGTASLYTSTNIAIMGGYAAAPQAKALVMQAEHNLPNAVIAKDHPYPAQDSARFYIRTYHDLRVIEEKLSVALRGKSKYDALFAAANDIMTALFAAADKAQAEKKK